MKNTARLLLIALFSIGFSSCSTQPEVVVDPNEPLFSIQVDGKTGFMDRNGRVVIAPRFEDVSEFSEGLSSVQTNRGFQFIDKNGNVVIQGPFDDARPFSEGLAAVLVVTQGDEQFSGYIDKAENVVIKNPGLEINTRLGDFSEGLLAIQMKGGMGYIDKTGKVVIEPRFEAAFPFKEGKAAVREQGQYGFIDKNGEWVIEPRFDDTGAYYWEGLVEVDVNGKWGAIDHDGNFVVEPRFERLRGFFEGLSGVKVGEKYGFIDTTGKMVIEPKFDDVGTFEEGLTKFFDFSAGKCGYIDRDGNAVIEAQFDSCYGHFEHGLANVKVNGAEGYIDKSGHFVWEPTQ